jgi:hypothetical protein
MSERILHRIDPRVFLDFDNLVKPIPLNANVREWAIPQHVLRSNVGLTLLGYVCPAAMIKIPLDDALLWVVAGFKADIQRFRAGRTYPHLAAQCLLLCGYDLPDELKAFAVPVPHSGEADGHAPASQLKLTEDVGAIAKRVPPVDQLLKLHQSLWVFILRNPYATAIRAQEEEYRELFCRLADALEPIRSTLSRIEGWPTRVARAFPVIIDAFDENARLWGWEGLAATEPQRSAYISDRNALFLEQAGRARYEAALSWQAGCRGLECPPIIDAIADEGRMLGFSATMTSDDGKALFKTADTAWHDAPRLGIAYPKISDAVLAKLEEGWRTLNAVLIGIVPREVARPNWHEQPRDKLQDTLAAVDDPTLDECDRPAPPNPPIRPRENVPATAAGAPAVRSEGTKDRHRPAPAGTSGRHKGHVFISYSHKDERFLNELRVHLKPYLRKSTFTAWSDKQIDSGSRWLDKINAALSRSSVAVMLVSPDFLDSDFIHEHELGPILKGSEAGGVRILWTLIRDCSYNETPLKQIQAVVAPPGKPFAEMRPAKRDTAWRKVCEEIKKASMGSDPVSG